MTTPTSPVSGNGEKEKQQQLEKTTSDPISQSIGDFGRWQFLLTFLLSLVNFPCTFHIFSPTFEGASRNFWCARPDGYRDVPVDLWKNYSGIFDIGPVSMIILCLWYLFTLFVKLKILNFKIFKY